MDPTITGAKEPVKPKPLIKCFIVQTWCCSSLSFSLKITTIESRNLPKSNSWCETSFKRGKCFYFIKDTSITRNANILCTRNFNWFLDKLHLLKASGCTSTNHYWFHYFKLLEFRTSIISNDQFIC